MACEIRRLPSPHKPLRVHGNATEIQVSRTKPNWPFVKINTDGSINSLNEVATLIRGQDGLWLGGFEMNIGCCDVIGTELLGVFQGIILAWELNYRSVEVETEFNRITIFVQWRYQICSAGASNSQHSGALEMKLASCD
ncbi:hypothetical protein DITRI_Ditri08aG0107000 [Diplodiscus trichospermus]